jgi:hypothetical protein
VKLTVGQLRDIADAVEVLNQAAGRSGSAAASRAGRAPAAGWRCPVAERTWTDADRELVAGVLHREGCEDPCTGHCALDAAAVLDALAAAGWTPPPRCVHTTWECDHCHDDPPPGHTCPRCGRGATDAG